MRHPSTLSAIATALCLLVATTSFVSAQTNILRVVASPTGTTQDGSSWENAMTLEDALTASTTGDQIWIAAGTYLRTTLATAGAATAEERALSFTIPTGISVYGGFEGDETSFTPDDPNTPANEDTRDRNATTGDLMHKTTLSGDLADDDGTDTEDAGYADTRDDNSNTVVRITSANVTINGLTIEAGQEGTNRDNTNYGAGIYADAVTPITIEECTFETNRGSDARSRGGAAQFQSPATLRNCVFKNNFAGNDAALLLLEGGTLEGCTFTTNMANGYGGGLHALSSTANPLTLENCAFTGNSATDGGGAYFSTGTPILINCIFTDNNAGQEGGGAYFRSGGTAINATLYNNTADNDGGGIYADFEENGTIFSLRNSLLISNMAADDVSGHQVYVDNTDDANIVNIQHNLIEGGAMGATAGIRYANATSPNVTEFGTVAESNATVVFASINADTGDYLRLATGSPAANIGNNDYVNNANPPITTDAAGNTRIRGGTVDLGAYESDIKGTQVITFRPAGGFVGTNIDLTAMASSGLEVSFAITTQSPTSGAGDVATLSGTTLTLINPGTVEITVSQTGDANYLAAPDVTRTITVRPAGDSATIFRVSDTGNAANNGSDWTNAMTLQVALVAAVVPGDQIWIAAGTYLPDVTNRAETFRVPAGVSVYGGFEGTDAATDDDGFDPAGGTDGRARETDGTFINETILSGDLANNDAGGVREDNSYTVVTFAGENVTLNGLTITGGERGTARISSTFVGAGLYAGTGTTGAVVELCTFNNNRADGNGGGAYFGSTGTLTGCTFTSNTAGYEGGGAYFGFLSTGTLTSCAFTSNTSGFGGGGAYFRSVSTLTSCTFMNNTTGIGSGGGASFSRIARLTTCTFTGNTSDNNGGGAFFFENAIVTGCIFTGNSAIGTSSDGGGGYFSQVGSTLTSCVFDGNVTSDDGGGAYFPRGGTVINTTFYNNRTGNEAGNQGGGIAVAYFNDATSSFNLQNSILIGNTAAAANVAPGHQVYVSNSNPASVVNLQYNLLEGGATGATAGIMYENGGSMNITETNTVDEDDVAVVFAESTDADAANYLRLATGSPVVNVGNNDYLNNGTPDDPSDDIMIDAAGNKRIRGGTVDFGAYETDIKGTQTIVDFALEDIGVVGVEFALTATASSGLAVTYTSSNANVAEVVNMGGTFSLRLIAAGTTTITALQVGDSEYEAATGVEQTILVRSTDPTIFRVTPTEAGTMDGSSWADAMTLKMALAAAIVASDQIWMAAGTYRPEIADDSDPDTDEREATFRISEGVLVYGGFEGTDLATDDDGFDPAGGTDDRARTDGTLTNKTILSGDLAEDDASGTRNDNSYTVVTLEGADVTLNGLTIEAGERGSPLGEINVGAGLFAGAGTAGAVVALCTFKDNNTTGDGGGAYFYETATVTSSTFTDNSSDSDGGGIYFDDEATLTSCTFADNSSGDDGGGAVFREISTLVNCVFVNNSATDIGGGIYFPAAGTILNSTFYNNMSSDGDGIFVRFDTNNPFTLQNSILVDPTGDSESGNQLYVENTEDNNVVNINYNLIEDGTDIVVFENEPGSNVGITNTRRIDDGATLFMSTTVGDANFFGLQTTPWHSMRATTTM